MMKMNSFDMLTSRMHCEERSLGRLCIFLFLFIVSFHSLIAQEDSYLGLKKVHAIGEIDAQKEYVLLAKGKETGSDVFVLSSEKRDENSLNSVALSDFYSKDEICVLKFKFVDKKSARVEIRFAQGSGNLACKEGNLRVLEHLSNGFSKNFYLIADDNGVFLQSLKIGGYYIGISTNCSFFKMYSTLPQAYIYEYTKPEKVGEVEIRTSEGYGTYYVDKPFIMPNGLKGSIITDADAANEELLVKWKYHEGAVVPACTALLVKGENGKKYSLFAPDNTSLATERKGEEQAMDNNYLRGSVQEELTTAPEGESVDSYKFYKLYYVTEVDENGSSKHLAFYWGEKTGGVFKNGANKAYLALPAIRASLLREFSLPSDPSTGILAPVFMDSHISDIRFKGVYTLDGRMVNVRESEKLGRGCYIVNGKKVLVK